MGHVKCKKNDDDDYDFQVFDLEMDENNSCITRYVFDQLTHVHMA